MSLCILTFSTTLFPPVTSSSEQRIRTMKLVVDKDGLKLPDLDDFKRVYSELEREFSAIMVLTPAEAILPITETAKLAAQSHGGTAKISVLDTQQLGPGLGILAQTAAQLADENASLSDIEIHIRGMLPHLFTLIVPDSLQSVKEEQTLLQTGSATDQPGMFPVFLLEEGDLTLHKKVRTQRHLLETLQVFIEEFEFPQQLVYFHGTNASLNFRLLQTTASDLFPNATISELELDLPLAALFGPQALGLTVLEMPEKK